jgi:hypothetical protein
LSVTWSAKMERAKKDRAKARSRLRDIFVLLVNKYAWRDEYPDTVRFENPTVLDHGGYTHPYGGKNHEAGRKFAFCGSWTNN